MGSLSCLNVAGGDIKLSYDRLDAAEAIRAKRMITEMLARGYALLVEVKKGQYQRAIKFDPKRSEYVIADYDPTAQPEAADAKEPKAKKVTHKRLPMEKTRAVGVARSAGG